jgi:dihydroorotate dehydrogenase electron transfer subunit
VIQTQITVVKKETIAPAWWRLTLSAPDLSPQLMPGQFLLLRCADRFTCYLRRPVFPSPMDDQLLTLLLYPDPDPGLAWLLTRQPGDILDVVGPLGTGFSLPNRLRNLLLVSDGQVIDPLLGQMSRAINVGVSVTLALGGSRNSGLYPVTALPPVVEFQAATLDGSLGHRGPVTDLLPSLLGWADAVCAVGSTKLYRALKMQLEKTRLRAEANYLFGLVKPYQMACGVGVCLSCVLETEAGLKLSCIDGPVFDLTTLEFGEND